MNIAAMIRLLRPHQFTKNVLVLAAPAAAGRLGEASVALETLVAVCLFCVVSSIGYVTNDLTDIERDRNHPRKRLRPLASGEVTPNQAKVVRVLLVLIVVATLPFMNAGFSLLLIGYMALTTVYSLALKQIPWVELIAVAAGFVIRASAGGAATDVGVSGWFLAVVSASALLLITGKRIGETITVGTDNDTRAVLNHYDVADLRFAAALVSGIAIGAYMAWANGRSFVIAKNYPVLIQLTALPLTIALIRYARLAWRGSGEQPDRLVLRDPVVAACGAAWVALYSLGIYL